MSVCEEGPRTSEHLPAATGPLGNLREGSQKRDADAKCRHPGTPLQPLALTLIILQTTCGD